MDALSRQIVVELAKAFLAALFVLTALWLIVGVTKQAVDQSLGPLAIAQLTPYLLPEICRLTGPISCVFAASTVYGRMSAANEFVAAKALGIHPARLVFPALFAASLLSLATVVLNDWAASWGRDGMERVVAQAIEQIAYGTLERSKAYTSSRFNIAVKTVYGRTLVMPTITLHGSPPVTIVAEEGEIRSEPESGELVFVLRRGVATIGRVTYSFDYEERNLEPLGADPNPLPTRMSLRRIASSWDAAQRAVDEFDTACALDVGLGLATGDFSSVTDRAEVQSRLARRRALREMVWRMDVEIHRRWAMGWSCLAFVLLAAPLAVWLRRPEPYASFGIAAGSIILVYYPVLMLALGYAKDGIWPGASLWLSNLLLLCPAGWFWREMSRH